MDTKVPREGCFGEQSKNASEYGGNDGEYVAEIGFVVFDSEPEHTLRCERGRQPAISAEAPQVAALLFDYRDRLAR